MDFEKMKQEEDAAVEMMYGKRTNVVDEDLAAIGTTFTPEDLEEDNDDDPLVEDVTLNDSGTQETTTSKPRLSWKKRFTSYKASTDNTIRELRENAARLNVMIAEKDDEIATCNKKIATLEQTIVGSVDPYKDIFTEADEEMIGSEAVGIIKKAMQAKGSGSNATVERLEKELEAIRKEKLDAAKREQAKYKADSLESLKVKLSSIVPDWNDIDLEPQFKTYIEGYDDVSGFPRGKLFSNAVNIGDVAGVARFYKEYQNLKPKSRTDILAEHVTPNSGGASSSDGTQQNKRLYSLAEYTKFMDDVTKGKYKHNRKEALKQERIFDIAFSEGRIR